MSVMWHRAFGTQELPFNVINSISKRQYEFPPQTSFHYNVIQWLHFKYSTWNKKLGKAENWAITVFMGEVGHALAIHVTDYFSVGIKGLHCNPGDWIVFFENWQKTRCLFWLGEYGLRSDESSRLRSVWPHLPEFNAVLFSRFYGREIDLFWLPPILIFVGFIYIGIFSIFIVTSMFLICYIFCILVNLSPLSLPWTRHQ